MKFGSFYKKRLYFSILILLIGVLVIVQVQNSAAQQKDEDQFEQIKKDILCRSVQFVINENNGNSQASGLVDCQSLTTIETTIPDKFKNALWILRLFKDKKYNSYGKGKDKLDKRLDKLIADIVAELKKIKKNDALWEESIKVLTIELRTKKDEFVSNPIENTNVSNDDANKNNTINTNNSSGNRNSSVSIILYFLLLIMLGGIGFLAYQNILLKRQMIDMEDSIQERYSRLDNRLDLMTPLKEHKSLLLRLNFINDQISALTQEVISLQSIRNVPKANPEELYAQRTEYLESHTFNPDVQVYYAFPDEFDLCFYAKDFRAEPSQENFFKIEINLEDTQRALLKIVDRSEYQQLALETEEWELRSYCDFTHKPHHPSRILVIEPGYLEKKGSAWVVIKKIKIVFE